MKKYSIHRSGKLLLAGLQNQVRLSLSVFLFAAASVSHAQVLLNEDFESGNLDSWTAAGGLLTISTTTNKIPTGGTYSAAMANSGDRVYTNLTPVVTADSCKLTYYLYDAGTSAAAATRSYSDVRNYDGGSYASGTLIQLLAAGKYSSVTMPGEVFAATKYQGRMLGTGYDWFNLNAAGSPNRSVGWHRFDIERGLNGDGTATVRYFVDGILSRSFNRDASALPAWNAVTIGFGAGSTAGTAYFDGVKVVEGQPYIQVQPQGVTNAIGTDTTLTVTAIGAATLSYQWYKAGVLLDGKTDSSLLLSNPQLGDSGNYTVSVTNSLDGATSSVAVVSIVTPLAIISQPQDSPVLNPGATNQFNVTASSANPITYQWKRNNVDLSNGGVISGATSASLTLSGISVANAGTYTVVVSDGVNPSVTSSNAILFVNTPPVGTGSNQTASVGSLFSYTVPVTDDFSVVSSPFQTFEAFDPGALVMFGDPTFSGTTGSYLDTNLSHFSLVTNVFPANHAGSKVVQARWSFLSSGFSWLRLTTATNAVTNTLSPIISFSRSLRFDMYSDRDIEMALGVRETNPSGPIGSNGGIPGLLPIEWVGATNANPAPTRTITGGAWTQIQFDLVTEPKAAFPGTGANGVLNSTTGLGVLEHLALVSTNSGEFNIYLDNFLVVETNGLTFTLISGPSGATIDAATGLISWTPAGAGAGNFEVRLTDSLGLSSTNAFTVTAGSAAAPTLNYSVSGSDITLTWTGSFNLQSKTNLSSPSWDTVTSSSPYTTAMTNAATFYRLQAP